MDLGNVWSSILTVVTSGHRIFYTSLQFDTKILVIRKVVLRVHDENTIPRTPRKVECCPLATVRLLFLVTTNVMTIFLTD